MNAKQERLLQDSKQYVVSALYDFVALENFTQLQAPLLNLMKKTGVKGTLLLAHEGINGTIAGTKDGVKKIVDFVRSYPGLANLTTKESYSDEIPFYRSKVKLKKEIVTMGVEDIDPNNVVGTYIKPDKWNELLLDPNVLVIDTRNDYEVQIGTFKNAINPNTKTFREFPEYAKENLLEHKDKKIAMFCTGGIRCEKSTSYLKQIGFDDVYHLEGGILKYLEEVPQDESLWQGECFVFDNRVSVKHGLSEGEYDQCYACRMPITQDDKKHKYYEKGVSCHHCYGTQTEKQMQSHVQRQKQITLAKERGQEHIGGQMFEVIAARRAAKRLKKHDIICRQRKNKTSDG